MNSTTALVPPRQGAPFPTPVSVSHGETHGRGTPRVRGSHAGWEEEGCKLWAEEGWGGWTCQFAKWHLCGTLPPTNSYKTMNSYY